MKKLFLMVLPVLLCCSLALPAFAADDRYVPQIPPFLSSFGGGSTVTVPYDKDYSKETTAFFKDFYDSPYLIVIDQQSTNGYYQGKDYGDDRRWRLMFVKTPEKPLTPNTFGSFVYYDPLKYPDRASHPIFLGSNNGFEVVIYYYNYTAKKFDMCSYQRSVGYFQFSYVIGSAALSNTAPFYPGYRTLARTWNFDSGHADMKGIEKHYNWWLATGNVEEDFPPEPDVDIDTDGDGKPDLNVDTDGDGEPDINIDTDGDKKPDLNIDTNGDKKPDVNIDTDGDGKPDTDIDTNGDKKPDLNLDTDGDGKADVDIDTNGDGKPDINVDTDGDKKPDIDIDTNGDKKPDINIDSNGDRKPDLNVDTDGDRKPDTNIDTNGNGRPNLNIDTDGDGKPDINVDTNGDGKPDVNIDTDGDRKPDYNIDADGDGRPDDGGGSSGGSSGGSGSGGSGSGGAYDPDYGKDWFPPINEDDYEYNDFPIFNPYDYDNYTPPPYTGYDPMEGYEVPSQMPQMPTAPILPDYQFQNPFQKPWL